MQPHLNEIDHWRNTSQRSSDSGQPKPPPPLRHRPPNDDNPKQFFAVDSSRGWLETSPIKNPPLMAEGSNGWSLERESSSESQKAKDMLGAVSNADILMLTKMTSNLSQPTRKPVVKEGRPRPIEIKTTRSNPTKEQVSVPLESTGNPFNTSDTTTPSIGTLSARTSHSTPPPSTLGKDGWDAPEHRQSWYKSLIKRDSKLKHAEDESSCDDEMFSSETLAVNNKPAVKRASSSERLRKLAANTPLRGRFWHPNLHRRMTSSSTQPITPDIQNEEAPKLTERRHSVGSIVTQFAAPDSQLWYEDEDEEFEVEDEDEVDDEDYDENEEEYEDEDEEDETNLEGEDEQEDGQPETENPNSFSDQPKQTLGIHNTKSSHEDIMLESMSTDHSGTSKTLLFDYDTLPSEVTGLLKEYERDGKLKIRHKAPLAAEEYENSDTELDEVEIISSEPLSAEDRHDRTIVQVQASSTDGIEFVKLVQLPEDMLVESGLLFDLHVSLVAEECDNDQVVDCYEEAMSLSNTVNGRIKEIKDSLRDSQEFLNIQKYNIASLSLDDFDHYGRSVALSRPNSTFDFHSPRSHENPSEKRNSSTHLDNSAYFTTTDHHGDQAATNSCGRAPSLLLNNVPFRGVNPFDYRKDCLKLNVGALQSELDSFKASLENTERLVRYIQSDVDGTRSRMELLIKNIPESHFSALKKLEVDIECILASRAKNPWLDTAYALLSYLLTVFALGVWTVICVLKYGRKVFSFPWRLWTDYKAHMKERNKAVKQASLYALSGQASSRSRQL
ncbi:hypothetical protein CLU79DRAFT_762660 [Phycomyces nitens]|nr:hypothetical protein CLU79DRAFT_762660 [Phycomyces nitens]